VLTDRRMEWNQSITIYPPFTPFTWRI